MAEQPEIRTQRLILRRPRLRDAPRIASLLNNFEVTKNLARVPYPYTINMAVDWLMRQKKEWSPDSITFAICEPRHGGFPFQCGLACHSEQAGLCPDGHRQANLPCPEHRDRPYRNRIDTGRL